MSGLRRGIRIAEERLRLDLEALGRWPRRHPAEQVGARHRVGQAVERSHALCRRGTRARRAVGVLCVGHLDGGSSAPRGLALDQHGGDRAEEDAEGADERRVLVLPQERRAPNEREDDCRVEGRPPRLSGGSGQRAGRARAERGQSAERPWRVRTMRYPWFDLALVAHSAGRAAARRTRRARAGSPWSASTRCSS
eukprot:1218976-Prymnesium_polylepis.1